MPLTADLLANGQLPSSKGTLFTAAGPTVVQLIVLVNTDASARTVNLYVKRATSRRITPVNLSLDVGAMYDREGPITLDTGDLIEGDASAATVVDYTIHGATTS